MLNTFKFLLMPKAILTQPVGWVEQRETQHFLLRCVGLRFANPTYELTQINVNRDLSPEGEILSIASPSHRDEVNAENAGAQSAKESIQRKGDSITACSSVPQFCWGLPKGASQPHRKRAASMPNPCGLFPAKFPILGAVKEITFRHLLNKSR